MERLNKTVSIKELFNPALLTQAKIGAGETLTVEKVKSEFPGIVLTEEEKAIALLGAYKAKLVKIEAEQKEQQRQRRIEIANTMWSFDECYNVAIERGKAIGEQRGFEFKVDDFNQPVFRLLAFYFSNDPRFEDYDYFGKKYSLKKGICLLSPIRGNGKTTLLDCFMYNKRGCYGKQSTKQMVKDYEKHGIAAVERFLWLLPIPKSASNFYQEFAGLHYDDFGDEEFVNYMGNKRQISSMIINSIYDDHRDDNLFHRFHISMNYKWSEYESKYGSNTASRMEEMFNLIPVSGASRR